MSLAFEHVVAHDQWDNGIVKRLGKAQAKSSTKMLMAKDYLKTDLVVPPVFKFWEKRVKFPIQDWGNNEYGNCTIASQGLAAQRMERLEQRKTIPISKDEIIRVYFNMLQRVYGTQEDMGAYELDALNNWRNPDYTFRDTKGRPLTIDAYVRVNHYDVNEIKKALFLAGAKGLKICFNLPWAWSNTLNWDITEGQQPIGPYTVGSWGGHSMFTVSQYDEHGVILPHTWNMPDGRVSWKGIATYCDEVYLPIDSINQWKKRLTDKEIKFSKLISDVNSVSDVKIK